MQHFVTNKWKKLQNRGALGSCTRITHIDDQHVAVANAFSAHNEGML